VHRGINDGDNVRVWNDRGECQLKARITDRVKPGVAVALSIWWNKLSPGHANVNQLASQELTDIGAGATFFDNLVDVRKS
jgi:anaerobic selenocysteine-containing dehydrogenase